MAEQTPRSVLNHLIETCRDSERGYRSAAGLVEGPALKTKLLEMANERARFAQELVPHAQRLGGDDVSRLRFGIGQPPPNWSVVDFVLSKFTKEESETVKVSVERAADAAADWVRLGVEQCMNRYN